MNSATRFSLIEKSPTSHHHHPPAMGTWGGSSAGGSRSRGGVKYKIRYYTIYKFYVRSVLLTCVLTLFCYSGVPSYPPVVDGGNPDAKRLYDDLLSNYNKLVRPVVNVSEAVTVMLKLKLSQLIDVVSLVFIIDKSISNMYSGFTFLIHVTNKILMDTDISYTLYHTCKRPFILRVQP